MTKKHSFATKKTVLLKKFMHSVWFFPAALGLLFVGLVGFQISGSSVGVYYGIFHGAKEDSSLLFGHPKNIRSDEWLVNTQYALAQVNNNFERINKNVGHGQDHSIIVDAPYKDWSIAFKPHNLAFFVMPFGYAFAFKWWFMSYLLVVSCYFFVLALLPGRKKLAVLLSLALLASPFIQWWYQYGTLASVFYSLFAGLAFVKIIEQKSLKRCLPWALLLAYVLACLGLVLYPPFQIPCALAVLIFAIGYTIEKWRGREKSIKMPQKLGIALAAVLAAGSAVGLFIVTRLSTIRIVQDTAYPGERVQTSGGFDMLHLFSNHLGTQFEFGSKAQHYLVGGLPTNQSEASNFVLLLPFLLLPSIYLLVKNYRKSHSIDWPLALVSCSFLLTLVWLAVPHLDFIGKVTLLKMVPHIRLLIGLGVLNLLAIVLFVRRYSLMKNFLFGRWQVIIYTFVVFSVLLAVGLRVMYNLPGFISLDRVIAYAVPLPVIMYLLLRKRFEWALLGLLLFSLIMVVRVHPTYQGMSVLTDNAVSQSIRSISETDDSRWAAEDLVLENFALMNGARSLSGIYAYPQLNIWSDVTTNKDDYNRYAHVNFVFDRDSSVTTPTRLELVGGDNFKVITEPCGEFLSRNDVRYLLTSSPIASGEACAALVKELGQHDQTLYIYRLDL